MKKQIFLIVSILTAGCAACLGGCAKNSDNTQDADTLQRIALDGAEAPDTEDPQPDDSEPRKDCPDGKCGRKGRPHTRFNDKNKQPIDGHFTVIFEFIPDFGHKDKLPDTARPEPAPTPEIEDKLTKQKN